MKISLSNFKSIEELDNLELTPLSLITGINSCGKSSLIHFLLLIKQSIELKNSDMDMFNFNDKYVNLGNLKSVLNNVNNPFEFSLEFSKEEILNEKQFFDPDFSHEQLKSLRGLKLTYKISYVPQSKKNRLDYYKFESLHNDKNINGKIMEVIYEKHNRTYSINGYDSTYPLIRLLGNDSKERIRVENNYSENISYRVTNCEIKAASLFEFNIITKKNSGVELYFDNNDYILNVDKVTSLRSPLLWSQRAPLMTFSKSIIYIGPLRDEPHLHYSDDSKGSKDVGVKGEYTAKVISKNLKNEIESFAISSVKNEDLTERIEFKKMRKVLQDWIEYWMCEQFNVSKNIDIVSYDDGLITKVMLLNSIKKPIPITHVGFGVSQIMPIVVSSLLADKNNLIILEQPEIHLHPSMQAKFMDFIISQSLNGVKFLIETHSDHMINRLRRRIAEDDSNILINETSIYFVERSERDNALYTKISISDDGGLTKWPKGFNDQNLEDQSAILRAQNRRRKINMVK